MVTAGRDKYMMSDPVEKRRSAPSLPAATAGTVEAARRVANNTIANIINLAATGSQPVDTKMDCDIPAIPGTSRGISGRATGGTTAPAATDTAAGGSGIQQEGATGKAGTNAAYKNLRQGAGASSSKKTIMYEEIMVQRRIRGEHAALGLGPGADMFE